MNSGSPENKTQEAPKQLTGIYALVLPTFEPIWNQVRQLVVDKSARMDDIASLACQDPAIVIELLKTSNSMFFSSGRPPVSTIKGTIERLGIDAAVETLDKLKQNPSIPNMQVSFWFEMSRQRCKRVARVARIMSDQLARTLNEDAEAAAGLLHVGEMLAVLQYKEQYVKMADEACVRAKILYRLEKDFKFSCDQSGISYLRRIGIPEIVLFAIDPNSQSKTPSRAPLRPICNAASELVIAFESEKLDKYAPGSTSIPPKSAIRMLKMTDQQYQIIFDQVGKYLAAEMQKNAA